MINCLEYAIYKENEIPRLIELAFNKFNGSTIFKSNKLMRTKDEILKDYGLGGD